MSQPLDTCWGGGQLPRHYSRPVGEPPERLGYSRLGWSPACCQELQRRAEKEAGLSLLPASHGAFSRVTDMCPQHLPCPSPPFPTQLLSSHSHVSLSSSDFAPPLLPLWMCWALCPPWSPLQGELQLLCMQLDRHISTHIRESPQAMHRTKLKDLATQTYIRWQELLSHCRPQVVPPLASGPGRGGKWSSS